MQALPLFDIVLVERIVEDDAKNGVVIPDVAKDKPNQGKVVAVGPGRITEFGVEIPTMVRPGDLVLFPKYTGTEVVIEGNPLLIMRESELQVLFKADEPGSPAEGEVSQ